MSLSPRWRKIARDAESWQGRLAIMILAIAVGVFAVGALSTGYSILAREIGRGYLATNPAAALFEVEALDLDAVAGAARQPGVVGAEASGRVRGRVEVRPNEWLPLLLFVVPDFAVSKISTVQLESGGWPSAAEEIDLERTALPFANAAVGGSVRVELPGGTPRDLRVAGSVYDASLAPAWQEQTVYGYVTPAAARLLGYANPMRTLKISVADPVGNRSGLERTAIGVASWLRSAGRPPSEIRIPPYRHPHDAQMTSVVRMLLVFGVLALVLGAVLTGTLTASLLAPQVRQIGVMKAIGARSAQILVPYAALVLLVGLLAVAIGLPPGVLAGRALAANTAHLLNLQLESVAVSPWVYLCEVIAAVVLPLAAALVPIRAATRRTVRETLGDYGVAAPSDRSSVWARVLSRITGGPALGLAARNTVRRKGRLALTVGLLATAGALFMTSLNVRSAWERNLSAASRERHFDAEIFLAKPAPTAGAVAAVARVSAVRVVEPFQAEAISPARADGLNVVSTYPDGGHGSLQLMGVPAPSAFVTPNVIEGRWLDPTKPDGVVLNEAARAMFPRSRVGDSIRVDVRGNAAALVILGVIREHLTAATVYAVPIGYERLTSTPESISGLRIGLYKSDEQSAFAAIAAVEKSLAAVGSRTALSITQAQLGRALGGHLFILIFVLVVTAILMALVGVLGLASAITTGVLERTRELAVMRAIGARSRTIRLSVIAEGVFVALISAAVGFVLSVPMTVAVVWVVGTASLGPSVDAVVSPLALPLWLAVVGCASVAATVLPAWQASRLTIREALSYQ